MHKTKLMLKAENVVGEKLEIYLPRIYCDEHKSSVYLGEVLGIHSMTVRRWLAGLGINLRDTFDYPKRRIKKPPKGALTYYYNFLRKPVKEIARERGVCPKTIYRWMNEYRIERRHGSEAYLKNGITRPSKSRLENLLSRMSANAVSSMFRINPRTLRTWRQKSGLYKPRKSRYDNKNLRKKMLDSLLKQTEKKPQELSSIDFAKLRYNDKTSYRGLLDWYSSHFAYGGFYQIKEHFIKEFYDGVISK